MITATFLFLLFFAGAAMFALGTGIIGFGVSVIGHTLKFVFSLLGFLLMPVAIILAIVCGIGFLLPIVVPAVLILFVIGLFVPKNAG